MIAAAHDDLPVVTAAQPADGQQAPQPQPLDQDPLGDDSDSDDDDDDEEVLASDVVPRALCTLRPATIPPPPPPAGLTSPASSFSSSASSGVATPPRAETPEDPMFEDCLQALSHLKRSKSAPRVGPLEPATAGGIVPPVAATASTKRPRKRRTPKNATAQPADKPKLPPVGRRKAAAAAAGDEGTGAASGGKPGRKPSTPTSLFRSHSHARALIAVVFFAAWVALWGWAYDNNKATLEHAVFHTKAAGQVSNSTCACCSASASASAAVTDGI